MKAWKAFRFGGDAPERAMLNVIARTRVVTACCGPTVGPPGLLIEDRPGPLECAAVIAASQNVSAITPFISG
jgi:hypothetical protein